MPAPTLAGLLALVASPAWPGDAASPTCDWTRLDDSAHAATVTAPVAGATRVPFVGGAVDARTASCPGPGRPCATRAYVVPGDAVLAGATHGAYTCAGFVDANGLHATVDWLPTVALRPTPPGAAGVGDWAGHWSAPEQELTIKAAPGGALAVNGSATWGAGDPWRVKNGGVNTGELDGVARPQGGVLAFTVGDRATLPYDQGGSDDCRLRLVLRGPYLIAKDNNNCGGNNVTFSGFYRRGR